MTTLRAGIATLASLVVLSSPTRAVDEDAKALPVPVPVAIRSALEIPPEVEEQFREEVHGIFCAGGLEIDWQSPIETAWIVVRIEARPIQPVISGCRRDRHDHRLAVARLTTRHITLWREQVARAVRGAWDAKTPPRLDAKTEGRALGRVVAHEIGHVLLGLDGHRPRGLLRKSFKHRELSGWRRARFELAPEDLERIRETALALHARQGEGVKARR